jgi:hypothetical protein
MFPVTYAHNIWIWVKCIILMPSFWLCTGWCRETGTFEIIRKKTKETYKTLFDPENVFYKSGSHFLKITSVKCCSFRCTHSVSRVCGFCIARRNVFSGTLAMFSSIRVLSWARFVGIVWYTRLFFSKPNQSLQSYEPTCVLRVQKELDRGAESHSGAETLFVQLSHCRHFGNTHSR